MTVITLLDRYAEFLQIALLLLAVVSGFRYARRSECGIWLILYILAMAACMLSELYWVAHRLIRGDVRIPFAANDIAEFGLFLLLASSLNAAVGGHGFRLPGVTAAALLFSAANILLWLGWSGEWLRDIAGGLPFAYFVCVCARSLRLTGALSRGEWIGLGAFVVATTAVESLSAFGPGTWYASAELAGYVLLAPVNLWFLVRSVLALAGRGGADETLSLCFSGYCWTDVTMYMAAGIWYTMAYSLNILFVFLMFLAVGKKVKQA